MLVVIVIIGVLATVGIISYSNFRQSVAVSQIKSDLNGVASAMENARNFGNVYPSSIPSTFSPSTGVTLTVASSSDEEYCIDASSPEYLDIHYYIDQSNSKQGAQLGTCATRPIPLTIPTSLAATATSDTTINVSWDAVVGATSYTLQRDIVSTFATATTIATQAGITFTSGSLLPSTTYYYRVQATNTYSASAWSATASAITNVAPTGLAATVASSTSINLSWDLVSGATSYTLQRDIVSTFATATTIATQAGITFTSSGLSQGTPYYYRVQYTGSGGTSSWSATATATTTISTPSVPSVTATTSYPTTTFSWGAASCASGTTARYQYRYTISPSGYDSGWVAIAGISVSFTTATAGQTYTVATQAQCYNANTSSGWSGSGSASYRMFSGALAYVDVLMSGYTGTSMSGVTISPDGAWVYSVAGSRVARFSRNTSTGALTYVDVLVSGYIDTAMSDITMSTDGAWVYSTAGLRVARFSRS